MKNIFTLKTDQKSNLYYNTNDKCFQVSEVLKDSTPLKENQFVYVVDTEELTTSSDVKDKWFLSEYGFVIKADRVEDIYLHHVSGGSNYAHFYKKVLLTNDTSLIADGVQEINSSFLSFFAAESLERSAENQPDYVEVEKWLDDEGEKSYSLNFAEKENKTEETVKLEYLRDKYPANVEGSKEFFEQEALEEAKNETQWFNEYQEVENYIIKRIGDNFLNSPPLKYKTASEATIALLEDNWQEEKLYTKQDLEQAHQQGAIFAYGRKEATRTDRLNHFEEWFEQQ